MFRLVHTEQHVIETFLRRLRFIIARNVINASVLKGLLQDPPKRAV
jgi:hypothetical protein